MSHLIVDAATLNHRKRKREQYAARKKINHASPSTVGEVAHAVVLSGRTGISYRVQHYYGCYDPLQYPLIFPFGQPGWHEGIEKRRRQQGRSYMNLPSHNVSLNNIISPNEVIAQEEQVHKGSYKRSQVSVREYYCYKLQIRSPDMSFLLHTGRLFQQYVIDMYVKIESARLDFIRHNQKQIRAELYQGIVDSIHSGETRGNKIGKRLVLPASFTGSPRDNTKRYMDAMALVQRFGKPDIFLTMTCNPNWKEIKDELMYEDEAQNRPDLVSRIFRAKLEELKKDLLKRKILGSVAASIYVVEFQKRGLPHVHFLLIMKHKSRIISPDHVDEIVSCEIPNEKMNSYLRSCVIKHMMHGPCGNLNPKNVCMQNGKDCKNKYPKNFVECTSLGNDSYALYKRRNYGETVKVRGHFLDNRWVVPYNPFLLAKFNCHINVEICSSIKAVKYLYKYLCKGSDRVCFSVNEKNVDLDVDEITAYQNARWICGPEAAWRIFEFTIAQNLPSVISLQLHLPDCQSVTFQDTDNLVSIAENSFKLRSMLTEYFRMNQVNENARNVLYRDFPKFFVWDTRTRFWSPRRCRNVIGRIVSASPNEGERYYERMLLNHIKGAISFENLRTVKSVTLTTFREAASEYGLLNDDKNSKLCLSEAIQYSLPSALRRLFATILLFCAPTDPKSLWLNFKDFMIDDLIKKGDPFSAEKRALEMINNVLELSGKNIKDYNIVDYDVYDSENYKLTTMLAEEKRTDADKETVVEVINMLNGEQKTAYSEIYNAVVTNAGGFYFIDGPGGTGKTFLYNALLSGVRSKDLVALATASSGVAASLLSGGRTAHSRFKLPLDIILASHCSISKQSALAYHVPARKSAFTMLTSDRMMGTSMARATISSSC